MASSGFRLPSSVELGRRQRVVGRRNLWFKKRLTAKGVFIIRPLLYIRSGCPLLFIIIIIIIIQASSSSSSPSAAVSPLINQKRLLKVEKAPLLLQWFQLYKSDAAARFNRMHIRSGCPLSHMYTAVARYRFCKSQAVARYRMYILLHIQRLPVYSGCPL